MLSIHQIDRLFRGRHFEPMLDAAATNGLALPRPLKLRLLRSHVPAMALGLRRLAELTYVPTPLSRQMLDALLEAQSSDGSFEHDPLATAAAAAAMSRLLAEPAFWDARCESACDRAMAALADMQQPDGLFHTPAEDEETDRARTGALVLALLAPDERFRMAVRFADLIGWFGHRANRLEPDTWRLWQLAMAGQPAPGRVGKQAGGRNRVAA